MTYLSKTDFVQTTANIATALFALFIGVQLLLAAGILPVSMFWGGRQTELTPALRIGSLVAVMVLGFFIYIIRYRAGLVGAMPTPTWVRVSAWIVTGYMAVNTLGNLASLSNVERFLFSPLALVLTVASLLVAASRLN
ncbi:MAG: hypothetical protein DWQ04_23255 [Chloroflexi bacterium]|nr:MAG: hypothetical protein DWQ04_23255 [Chloroflexota bacterium]